MTFAIHGFCASSSASTSTSCSFAPHFQQKNGGRPRVAPWVGWVQGNRARDRICVLVGGINIRLGVGSREEWMRWGGVPTQTVGLIDLSCDVEFLSSSVHRIFNVKWRAWFSATEEEQRRNSQYVSCVGGGEFKRMIMGGYVRTSSPFPKVVNRAGKITLLLSTIIHHPTLQEHEEVEVEGCVWRTAGKVSTRALLWLFRRLLVRSGYRRTKRGKYSAESWRDKNPST